MVDFISHSMVRVFNLTEEKPIRLVPLHMQSAFRSAGDNGIHRHGTIAVKMTVFDCKFQIGAVFQSEFLVAAFLVLFRFWHSAGDSHGGCCG